MDCSGPFSRLGFMATAMNNQARIQLLLNMSAIFFFLFFPCSVLVKKKEKRKVAPAVFGCLRPLPACPACVFAVHAALQSYFAGPCDSGSNRARRRNSLNLPGQQRPPPPLITLSVSHTLSLCLRSPPAALCRLPCPAL